MYFRRRDGISGITLQLDLVTERLFLPLEQRKASIEVRSPTEWEFGQGVWMKEGDFIVEVRLERRADKHTAVFEQLRHTHKDSIDGLPDSFAEFSSQLVRDLGELTGRAIDILRWRHGVEGPAFPDFPPRIDWSEDADTWYRLPIEKEFIGWNEGGLRPDSESLKDAVRLLDASDIEPLGYELLTEAWLLMTRGQRRASLLMCVAAAEVRFKRLVATLVPASSWLIENVPTPPLERMLVEYLKELPTAQTVRGARILPSDNVLAPLKKAVALRNRVAHLGQPRVEHAMLIETLEATRDLLYLLDFYEGHRWALEHVREKSLEELGVSDPEDLWEDEFS